MLRVIDLCHELNQLMLSIVLEDRLDVAVIAFGVAGFAKILPNAFILRWYILRNFDEGLGMAFTYS